MSTKSDPLMIDPNCIFNVSDMTHGYIGYDAINESIIVPRGVH